MPACNPWNPSVVNMYEVTVNLQTDANGNHTHIPIPNATCNNVH